MIPPANRRNRSLLCCDLISQAEEHASHFATQHGYSTGRHLTHDSDHRRDPSWTLFNVAVPICVAIASIVINIVVLHRRMHRDEILEDWEFFVARAS